MKHKYPSLRSVCFHDVEKLFTNMKPGDPIPVLYMERPKRRYLFRCWLEWDDYKAGKKPDFTLRTMQCSNEDACNEGIRRSMMIPTVHLCSLIR